MKNAGLVLLSIAAVAFLLGVTKVATFGPCTSTLGAICLLSLAVCLPIGALLLVIAGVRHAIRVRKDAQSAPNLV